MKIEDYDFDRLLKDLEAAAKRKTSVELTQEVAKPARGVSDVGKSGPMPGRASLVVLTALENPERQCVLEAFGTNWRAEQRDGVLFRVSELDLGGTRVTVAVACQNDMGLVPAAILATIAVRAWSPRLVAMSGICAGVEEKVELGDLIVAQTVFDYGSGKMKAGKLHPDYEPVRIDEDMASLLIDYKANHEVPRVLHERWPGDPLRDNPPSVWFGPIASGAAVVADDSVVKDIMEHKRSLFGVDMEAYAMAQATVQASGRAAKFLVIKGVSDLANEEKGDDFQRYAAFMSAGYLRAFLSTNVQLLFPAAAH